MKIEVAGALGYGITALAAFDDALLKVGAGNYNLIRLSSVIPPGTRVILKRKENEQKSSLNEFGWRLYAVYASEIAAPGQSAWAGLGWVQRADGHGLFVEHEAISRERVSVLIDQTLDQMKRSRRWPSSRNNKFIIGGRHSRLFTCALIIAKYQSQAW